MSRPEDHFYARVGARESDLPNANELRHRRRYNLLSDKVTANQWRARGLAWHADGQQERGGTAIIARSEAALSMPIDGLDECPSRALKPKRKRRPENFS